MDKETIVLAPKEFDRFVKMCNTKTPIGNKLREAANRFDEKGYQMKISALELQSFVNERFDDVQDDYDTLHQLCEVIIKANQFYDEGNAIAALDLIRDYNNAALETKSYIDESLVDPIWAKENEQ